MTLGETSKTMAKSSMASMMLPYCKAIKDGKSAKQKKAEKMKLKGSDIETISERVFYDMLGI